MLKQINVQFCFFAIVFFIFDKNILFIKFFTYFQQAGNYMAIM